MGLIEHNNKSIHWDYLPVYLIGIFLFSIFAYQFKMMGSFKEYSVTNGLEGVVESKFINNSYVYVKLNTDENKYELEACYNYRYDLPELKDFLEIGDYILKKVCSDREYLKNCVISI